MGESENLENSGRIAPHLSQSVLDRPGNWRANVVTVVAGLPRSGTSLLMQMLAAGGMPILSDDVRKPDEDNPRGYLELEATKALRDDASFLADGSGRAVKIIAPMLPYLPVQRGRLYRVVFTQRDLEEVLASQTVMLARLGRDPAQTQNENASLRAAFHRQLVNSRDILAQRPDVDTLFVHYPKVVANPMETARAIANFVPADLDPAAMAAAMDRQLHRQRR
ncbi:sulfotransferase [Myxococcota bacterium]|nr:sulfotransferase [Myxococcota bacterium]